MTHSQARAIVRQFARNGYDLTTYPVRHIDQAISGICDEFIGVTHCTHTLGSLAISSGTTALPTLPTGFRPENLHRAFILAEDDLDIIAADTLLDLSVSDTSTGAPKRIAFTSLTTGLVHPTPDAAYTMYIDWSEPFVSLTEGAGYLATATATISGGVVTAVTVNTPGGEYAAAPNITFTGGGGTLAAATATIDSAGYVTTIAVTNGGSGYTTAPTVVFSGTTNADVTLNLPNDYLRMILSYGAPALLQHNDPDHGFGSESYKKYVEFRRMKTGRAGAIRGKEMEIACLAD